MKKLTISDVKNAPVQFNHSRKIIQTQLLYGMCFAVLQVLCGVAICYAAYVLREVI